MLWLSSAASDQAAAAGPSAPSRPPCQRFAATGWFAAPVGHRRSGGQKVRRF